MAVVDEQHGAPVLRDRNPDRGPLRERTAAPLLTPVPDPADDSSERTLTPQAVRTRLMMADAAAGFVGVLAMTGWLLAFGYFARTTAMAHVALAAASTPAFVVGALSNRLYQARANARITEELSNIVRCTIVGALWMELIAYLIGVDGFSHLWVVLVSASIATSIAIERLIARRIFARLRSNARLRRRIVIVGTDSRAVELMQMFNHDPSLGYEVLGFVGNRGDVAGNKVIGSIEQLERVLERYGASGVVVSPSSIPDGQVNAMTRRLTDAGYHVMLSSALWDIDIARIRPQVVDGRTMIYVEPIARSGAPVVAKRVFDIAFASALLIISAPLLLASAIAIKLTSPGPVFFRQTRVGRNGAPFTMVKLRTMVADAEVRKSELQSMNEADGPLFKIKDDPRITRVGRFLRRYSIDELPQLVSVLTGAMSMVGPRPALPDEVERWDDATTERLRVLPGLTGLWQVSGRSETSFESYRRLDLFYVDNWSLTHDVRICARTIGVVITSRGAS